MWNAQECKIPIYECKQARLIGKVVYVNLMNENEKKNVKYLENFSSPEQLDKTFNLAQFAVKA